MIGADIIRAIARASKAVLVLAHRREIIAQTSQKLYALRNSRTASSRPGFTPRPLELVQVASIQTLWVRSQHTGKMDLPPADLLVIDECHHAPANTYRKIIDAYPDADAARPDRNAMPRRRSRARRHLRHDDRMPAGRGADRAAATWCRRASMRRSIPI